MMDKKNDPTAAAFSALEQSLGAARIAFRLDLGKLCHPHCPLPLDHYKTKIAYAYIGLMVVLYAALSVFGLSGWPFWAPLVGFTAIYWIAIRPLAERWVSKQIIAYIMDDPGRLETIWRYGGVALVASDGTSAAAPKDDWRRFVAASGAVGSQ
jgi:hypothetical protein